MPELPEVETIRLTLQNKIVGLKIKNIELLSPKSFIGEVDKVQGHKVLNIIRRGKVLGINVIPAKAGIQLNDSHMDPGSEAGMTILFHFKMSGQLIYEGFVGGHPTQDMLGKMPNSHTRVIFEFSDKSHMYFNDQRRFGWVKVVKTSELEDINHGLSLKMGPEPLEKDFNWKILKQNLLKHPKTPIKVALMDHTVVVGVGNIYANEAVFDAKLDPRKLISKLTDEDFKNLYKGIVKSLKAGIKYGGATRSHFVDAEGKKGYFLDFANVYNQDKKPCKRCGEVIQKIKLGGRGTFYCPNCQK